MAYKANNSTHENCFLLIWKIKRTNAQSLVFPERSRPLCFAVARIFVSRVTRPPKARRGIRRTIRYSPHLVIRPKPAHGALMGTLPWPPFTSAILTFRPYCIIRKRTPIVNLPEKGVVFWTTLTANFGTPWVAWSRPRKSSLTGRRAPPIPTIQASYIPPTTAI